VRLGRLNRDAGAAVLAIGLAASGGVTKARVDSKGRDSTNS